MTSHDGGEASDYEPLYMTCLTKLGMLFLPYLIINTNF